MEDVDALVRRLSGNKFDQDARRCLIELVASTLATDTAREGSPPAAVLERPSPPLALISQVQRSGGSLLIHLLDGHPELWVHPHELKFGLLAKWDWPTVDLQAGPVGWLAALLNRALPDMVLKPYFKGGRNRFAKAQTLTFPLDLTAMVRHFLESAGQIEVRTARAVIDCYFAAFMHAWNHGRAAPAPRFVVGFSPRLVMRDASLSGLLATYPDGHVICVVRAPDTWLASAQHHSHYADYVDAEAALALWAQSAGRAIELARTRPANTTVLTYEALVGDTEATMRTLAEDIGIAFDTGMTRPTIAGQDILSNSSYDIATPGVHRESLSTAALLSPALRRRVEANYLPIYRQALAACRRT